MTENNTDASVATEEKPKAADEAVSKESEEIKGKNPEVERSGIVKEEGAKGESLFDHADLGVLNEVSIVLTIEIGRAQIKIRDLLSLTKGSIIELNKLAGDPVDIYANGKLISTGNIITANGKYCVRITSISDKDKNKVGAEANVK